MSIVRYVFLLFGIVLTTSTAQWLLSPMWFPLDLFLVAVVLVSLRASTMSSQLFGACAGLLQDIYGSGIIGLNALSKTIIGFFFAILRQAFIIKGVVRQTLAIFLATVMDALIYAGFSALFSLPASIEPGRLLVSSISNTVVGLAAILIIRRFLRNREHSDSGEIA